MAGIILAGSMPSAGLLSIQQDSSDATADLALTTTTTDIAGATVTLTAQTSSAFYIAVASFDMDKTSASASTALAEGILNVDGVDQAGEALARFNVAAVARTSVARSWSGTLAAGSHTFKLRGRGGAASIWVCRGTHTSLTVVVFG